MPRRSTSTISRSRGEWAVRSLLALAAMAAGYGAVRQRFADVTARRDPAIAHRIAPGDAQIAAALAEERFTQQPTADPKSMPGQLARRALLDDPTTVRAVTVVGLQAQLRGDLVGARRAFGYAERLSRRHLPTQLWAIEDAVGRGDIVGALRHYDIALRTSRAAADVLFPVLAAAMSDPAIRMSLTATMVKAPLWAPRFIDYLIAKPADPQASAALYTSLRRAGVPVRAEADASVIDRLLASDEATAAWLYYAAARRGADPRRSRDPRFIANLTTPSIFDWRASIDPNLAASFQRSRSGGLLDFATVAGAGGQLVQQMQMLPPGRYRLVGHSIGLEQPVASRPYWTLTCRSGAELGRISVPDSATNGGVFMGRFDVPTDCPMQILALVARPSDAVAGVSGQIDRLTLAPAK